jgi:hypothetical protein
MALRLSTLRVGRAPVAPGGFAVPIPLQGSVDPGVLLRLLGLRSWKNPLTLSGMEPTTFRDVAQRVNRLSYRVPLVSIC